MIPKAPTTDETREVVLARLRARVQPAEPLPEAASSYVIPKAPSTNESREDVLARLRAKAAAAIRETEVVLPETAPAPLTPPSAPLPVPKARITAPLTEVPAGPERIHTYKTDFASQSKTRGASKISVLAAEADAVPTDRVIFKEKKPFPTAIVGGFFLILLGSGALYAAYHFVTNKPMTIFVPHVPSLIAPDERMELTSDGVFTEFLAGVAAPLPEGKVRIMYTSVSTTTADGRLTTLPQSGGTVVRALSLPMPDILARSIMAESTVGVIHAGTEQRAFFMLRVDSFERSFAGMLDWERKMAPDLEPFYPAYPASTATSTVSVPEASAIATPIASSFKDELVGNRDVRVMRDSEGRSLMLYGFPDKETVIIARDEAAYTALVERLAASRGQ